MNRVATPGYLRYPHVHGDLLTFVTEDDVWLAPAEGGRAWRLTSDGGQASNPRFSPDGATIAWTSWRDGGIPEVYTAELDGGTGGPATRRTYWGDLRTRTTGWTDAGEVLATTAVDQPSSQRTHAYAVPLDAPPRRLPFGQVNDLALTTAATALLTGQRGDPAYWKRYRGGTGGRLWVATGDDPLFTRVLSGLDGQLASPMIIGGRLVFLSDHEGTGNVYSAALDGTDLRRHTDHDGFYARNPATDGSRVVYHVAGDIWLLDSLDPDTRPRKLDIQLTTPPTARAPKLITADDHLGDLDCDKTGQASVVTVRGTVHWLTHDDGPARALLVDPAARARLPRVLGPTGSVAWVTDASGADAIEAAEIDAEHPGTTRIVAAGDLGNILDLASSPDGAKLAATAADGRLLVIDVESGETTELARNDDGEIEDIAWSPDSAWLAWAQPGPQPLARIRLARIADGSIAGRDRRPLLRQPPGLHHRRAVPGVHVPPDLRPDLRRALLRPVVPARRPPLPGAAGRAHAVAVRSPARRPPGRRRGKFKRCFLRTVPADCGHRRASPPGWSPSRSTRPGTTASPRSRAAWSGSATRSPGCSATAPPTSRRAVRSRCSSGSTSASARRACSPPR